MENWDKFAENMQPKMIDWPFAVPESADRFSRHFDLKAFVKQSVASIRILSVLE